MRMTHLLPLQEGTFVMPLKPLSWSFSGWKSVLSLESPVSLREEQTNARTRTHLDIRQQSQGQHYGRMELISAGLFRKKFGFVLM